MAITQDAHTELEQDVLREIANIGAGHAATALSELLGRPIEQNVANVKCVPLGDVPYELGGPEQLAVGSIIELQGEFSGQLFMLLDVENAERVISIMTGEPMRQLDAGPLPDFSEIEFSALAEVTNIIGSSYLVAISEMTGLKIRPSIPALCADMVGAVLGPLLSEAGMASDYAVLFESALFSDQKQIFGNLFLVPHRGSCDVLLKTLLGTL